MPQSVHESRALTVREADSKKSGRLQIGIITPGWGSSGYYSDKVLENAATAKVFPAGTQMFLDHETESEKYDRPERSVRDLAAVLTEDATWDGTQLVGEAQVFGPYVDMLTDPEFAKAIGVSIRAYADGTIGEAEGRKGRIVTRLTEALSVDFVTRAGRGGSVLAVLESARPGRVVERAIAHGVAEATANDTREALAAALREEYGGDKTWVWVRDFDDTTVWFTVEAPDQEGTFAQAYQLQDNGAALLDGEPVEVRARTEYVPVTAARESGTTDVPAPAGQPHPTQSSKEDTMGTIQVDEAEHGRLTEAAGRVAEAENRAAAAEQRANAAEAQMQGRDRRDAAAAIIDTQAREAGVTFTALERRGLLTELPVVEGQTTLDAAAFTQTVSAAVAEKSTSAGAGNVRGFGVAESTSDGAPTTWADIDAITGRKGA